MRYQDTNRKSRTRGRLILLAAAAVAVLMIAAPAEAGHKHKHVVRHVTVERHVVVHPAHPRVARRGNGRVVRTVPAGFVVPARIHRDSIDRYRTYYDGGYYDRGIGAYLEVYEFPVRTTAGVVYRRHCYRNGILITDATFIYDGPRISFRINF